MKCLITDHTLWQLIMRRRKMKMFHFWYILVQEQTLGMFLCLQLFWIEKILMLLNAFSMFSCLFMAHISQHYNQIKKNNPDKDQDNE